MATMERSFAIRLATIDDVPAIRSLIEQSVRTLQLLDYSPQEIEGSLEGTQGVDTRLVEDETYYVAEAAQANGDVRIVGCGGWSKRKTLFGSDQRADRSDELLDPATDAAKIRAFFVHPEWTRLGIATEILRTCEDLARTAGFHRFEMTATLTGLPMYLARGYTKAEHTMIPLANGGSFAVWKLEKSVPGDP
jgi:N-acetylglutamate synthase-like GNAT family acetyltransferase